MTEKQKPAKIAKLQSQKERLTIASTKAPLGKMVSPLALFRRHKEILAGYGQVPTEG
jgi:hypothetical protein